MKKLFWIVVEVLISAIIVTSLTVALEARSEKTSDPVETSAHSTTVYVAPGDIPECENPWADISTMPPQVEPEWPEAPGAE